MRNPMAPVRVALLLLVAACVAPEFASATVPGETSHVEYAGNGSTVAFPVSFPYLAKSDIVVKEIVAGASTTKALTTHYTLTDPGASGTVTMLTAPPTGTTLRIERTVPLTQATSLRTQGTFSPAVHENAFDKTVMMVQQLDRRVGELADAGVTVLSMSQADADARYVNVPGDTMTGRLNVDTISGAVEGLSLNAGPLGKTLYLRGHVSDAAAAINARTVSTVALTLGTDRFVECWYRDNDVNQALCISSNGSLVPSIASASVGTAAKPFDEVHAVTARATSVVISGGTAITGSRRLTVTGVDFASIPAASCAQLTYGLAGVVANTPVACAFPAALEAGLAPSCHVSAADIIAFRLCNATGVAIDPAIGTFAARTFGG